MKLFVEGGGDGKDLRTECRAAFSQLFARAGIASKPRIVASGSRNNAFKDFRSAVSAGEEALLLVDAEAAVDPSHAGGDESNWRPWSHLHARDEWERPGGATDEQCHLMVQCMENWLLADVDMLASFYGHDFKRNKLPGPQIIESIPKADALRMLEEASAKCQKGGYRKGSHSFKLLMAVDPQRLQAAAPWARRLFNRLR